MKTADLRQNNIILDKHGNFAKVVTIGMGESIRLTSHKLGYKFESCRLDECKEILLTEEILLKCDNGEMGIAWKEKSYRGKYATISISGILFYFFTDNNTLELSCRHDFKIQFLHQFQNLFSALTQTELEIKL
jgi:hypothetical protein